ncbi:hypothetical protein SAMN04487967_2054 [Natronorubrum sediminis]|uniref:Zinc-ribbon domain-containing protein n=1 Tax=Natronorubrum sediminis TaxID=640943 RepID=A0A1H6FZF6_9EURY|nr:hypothetical protein [Natronorubrum sediminis]SEH15393.1 hypothetical protein SAMN04487967_2054 [Natronorubrum sediminis]
MSMFERLGEKVERFKQEAVAARDDSAEYRCRNCGAEIYNEQSSCPECGSTKIEPVSDGPTADESDGSTSETPNSEGETDREPGETASDSTGESGPGDTDTGDEE